MHDVLEAVRTLGWAHHVAATEGEVYCSPCPKCGDGEDNPGKNVRSRRGFSISLDHGAYHCKRCDARGVVTEFVNGSAAWTAGPTSTGYVAPPSAPVVVPPLATYWRALGDSVPARDYLKGRGFTYDAVKAWRLGYDPSRNAITIPTISKAGDVLGYKYRMINPGEGPKYGKTRGTPSQPVGLHLLANGSPLVITEGELDAVALWQLGVRPVVSIPSGASSFRAEWATMLSAHDRIVLAYDDDEAGDKGAQTAAAALGLARCRRVTFPHKDAAECLRHGVDAATMKAAVSDARPAWTPDFFVTAGDLEREIVTFLRHEATVRKITTGVYDLDQCLGGGLCPGDLTFIYGKTSAGKSTLALSILVNALRAGVPSMSASMEYIEAHHARIIAGQQLGKHGFKVTAEDIVANPGVISSLPLTVLRSGHDYGVGDIENALRHASAQGIRLAVFDPLDHIMPDNPNTRDYYGDVARFVRNLRNVVKDLSLHLIVVCPVTKEGDLAGRNSLKHDAWNLLEIQRDEDDERPNHPTAEVRVVVHKARRTGVVGRKLDLLYLKRGARIVAMGDDEGTGSPF